MKYCIDFNNHSKYLDDVDEIRLKYDKQKIEAIQYIKEHSHQTIILYIEDTDEFINSKDIDQFSNIAKEDPNLDFKIELSSYKKEYMEKLNDVNFKYFFNTYIRDWDTFLGYMNLGVSDIYIVESLGFELDKISKIAHDKNIKIRCFANIAQSSWKETDALKKFFIRPEDIELYEPYIDTICFLGHYDKIDLYYKIYKNDKKWYGNLKELIIDLDIDLDSKYIIPRFAEKRIRCGKECIKGGKCNICERIVELSNTLEKANLIVRIDKKEENKNG